MTNFLQETLSVMEEKGKTKNDILQIGTKKRYSWDEEWYIEIEDMDKAFDFDYDSGYGGNEIPMYLFIVFKDGTWLSRGEYDGSEWWNYNEIPKIPTKNRVYSIALQD